jgi:hypothetical protein
MPSAALPVQLLQVHSRRWDFFPLPAAVFFFADEKALARGDRARAGEQGALGAPGCMRTVAAQCFVITSQVFQQCFEAQSHAYVTAKFRGRLRFYLMAP